MGIKEERKFENLHKLVQLLLDHPEGLTRAEIARRLNVHRSTADEYLDDLPKINAPVYEVTPNRFTINRDEYKVTISVDMHEALALHLAARLLTTRTDKHYPHAAGALRKLGAALDKLAPLVSQHMLRSADALDGGHRRRDSAFLEVLETLTRAWARGRLVHLTYALDDGQVYPYTYAPYFIEPYAVGRTLHVIGQRRPQGDLRTFKIERIRTARLLDEPYTIPPDFDPRAHLRDAWGIWIGAGEPQKVVLCFSANVARRVQETQWHHTEHVDVQPDGALLWTAQVSEPKEMLNWIRGWGSQVEVLEPKALRDTLKREAGKLAKVYQVAEMKKLLIAHVREKDKDHKDPQYLQEHLVAVSKLAGQFASKVGMKETGEVLGLLHDFGKASQEFQNYLLSGVGLIDPDADGYVDVQAKKGKIDHSTAGAQVIFDTLWDLGQKERIAAQVLALCIASHHSGLIDCLSPDGEDNFKRRINKSEASTHKKEALSNLREIVTALKDLLSQQVTEQIIAKLISLIEKDSDSKETISFKHGLLIRFLLSCLIDADRLDTADFETPNNLRIRNYSQYHSWETLIERLDCKLLEFEQQAKKNEVDKLREQVSHACFDFATKPKGIYQLTVPTGGGKTLSSLRFALNHAAHHKMDRVFYIIPFTTIIDQNADDVRKILEDKDEKGQYLDRVVLEHHSNLTPEEETRRQNLLAQNWDAPVVFTTQVQFLEALFSAGTRGARRMHQLANSVIILDEVQAVPINSVHMLNVALRFLVHSCGATVILCTATQPPLDKIELNSRALTIHAEQRIIQNEEELFEKLKRVYVFDVRKVGGWSVEEVAALTGQGLEEKGSVLIVVNTKKSARRLYQSIAQNNGMKGVNLYHLSTNMCPAHRLRILDLIKGYLKNKEPVICVSTQLIEAGVDIDFGAVIRYLAGLDSIAQSAGRCNRHGNQAGLGNVWIVNPQEENISKLKDIKIGAEKAQRVLGEFQENPEYFGNERTSLDAMAAYYNYYFYERRDEMRYRIGADSPAGREDDLFSLLSTNPISLNAYKRINSQAEPETAFRQSFQAAAKAFRVIDSPTIGVVVPYQEGDEIIKDLCGVFEVEKQFKLLKRAQRFSVNLFPEEFKRLADLRAVREVQEGAGVFYLDAQYYSEQFGWSDEIVNAMEFQSI